VGTGHMPVGELYAKGMPLALNVLPGRLARLPLIMIPAGFLFSNKHTGALESRKLDQRGTSPEVLQDGPEQLAMGERGRRLLRGRGWARAGHHCVSAAEIRLPGVSAGVRKLHDAPRAVPVHHGLPVQKNPIGAQCLRARLVACAKCQSARGGQNCTCRRDVISMYAVLGDSGHMVEATFMTSARHRAHRTESSYTKTRFIRSCAHENASC
jgi:hypothetical protein